jgi:hypothetical protein
VNDFIGSTNAADLVLKTNGIERIRVYSGETSSGIILSIQNADAIIGGVTVGRGNNNLITNTVL